MAGIYESKPDRLLKQLALEDTVNPGSSSYCAGFELQAWRCEALANHIVDWIADYALKEEELQVNHGNMYVRLRQAAVRIYTSKKYQGRGEIGEILLHAICRDYFGTIPIAPRVFYLSASNDVVKSFDMVHIRYLPDKRFELWLGEAKFYKDAQQGIQAAIASISEHIDQGFLNNEKLLLGPQISKNLPNYQEVRDLLSDKSSLDELFEAAVFPVCIASNSDSVTQNKKHSATYIAGIKSELAALVDKVSKSGLTTQIKILLIYVPLGSKEQLASEFDKRLKGLQP